LAAIVNPKPAKVCPCCDFEAANDPTLRALAPPPRSLRELRPLLQNKGFLHLRSTTCIRDSHMQAVAAVPLHEVAERELASGGIAQDRVTAHRGFEVRPLNRARRHDRQRRESERSYTRPSHNVCDDASSGAFTGKERV
jgi:hypothetical protein